MMFEATTLYGFWGNRREGFETAAVRMDMMLGNLAPIHPAFEPWQWADPVSKEEMPYGGEPRTIDALVAAFLSDWSSRELDRTQLPGVGFSTRGWNGEGGPRSAGFRCSLENVGASNIFPNTISLTLQSRRVGDPTLIRVEPLARALGVLATAWDVVWATVFPFDLWETMDIPPGPLRTGWITYLSASLASRFVAPPGHRVEPGPAGGLMILTTDAVFDPEDPEHLASARAIQAALDLIQPPNPNADSGTHL